MPYNLRKPILSDSFQAESAVASASSEDEGTLREKIRGQVEYYLSRQNLLQVWQLRIMAVGTRYEVGYAKLTMIHVVEL